MSVPYEDDKRYGATSEARDNQQVTADGSAVQQQQPQQQMQQQQVTAQPGATAVQQPNNGAQQATVSGQDAQATVNNGATIKDAISRVKAGGSAVPTVAKADDDDDEPPQVYDMGDVIDYAERRRQESEANVPTKEQLEKERKRNATNRKIAAISDAVSAISDMFFAHKGAKPTYDAEKNMTEAEKKRYDKFLDDYKSKKKDLDEWTEQVAKLRKSKSDDEYKRWSGQKELKWKQYKAEAEKMKAESDARLAELKIEYQNDRNGYLRAKYDLDNEYKNKQIELVDARKSQAYAAANASNAKARKELTPETTTTVENKPDRYGTVRESTKTVVKTHGATAAAPATSNNKQKGHIGW
jgi:hypothetical protein